MLRPPKPCPWEDECASCAEREQCQTWIDYVNTTACYREYGIIEDEHGNLHRVPDD